MVDWIFYEEAARDMMREAYIGSANPKAITAGDMKQYADEYNLGFTHLKCAYGNVKHKFDPKDDFA
jgi:hypothetical protein